MTDRTPFDHEGAAERGPALLVIAHDPAHRETILGAALATGVVPIAAAASAVFAGERAVDIVAVDIRGLDDERAEATLLEVDVAARAMPLQVVVGLGEAQIDLATALIFGLHVQHLIDPAILDYATALAHARGLPPTRARDAAQDADRLMRLNAEVARIADALARLSRETAQATGNAEAEAKRGVRDFARSYGAPPRDAALPKPGSAAEVRAAIRARRLRAAHFDAELFADPAWDMLLDLHAATLEGARVSVSSLCIAAAVPGTTALRWIVTMTEAGLFERQADPADRRRAFIALTPATTTAMSAYFAAIRAAGLAPA
jgi:hypothetical protein